METKSILTIQSHVVHGYVGNRASTFPLQVLGWDVDVLNTVQLSNHTGYGKVFGQKLTGEEIWTQYEGLKNIDMEYDALLTGYIPTAEGLETVGKIAADLKKSSKEKGKQAIWLLDPVIGDNGRFYVSQDVIPVYQRLVKSGNVDLITPNQFEAETLTGIKIKSLLDIFRVLEKLQYEFKIPSVVISSIKLEQYDCMITVGSEKMTNDYPRVFFYKYPFLDGYVTGTGDLFAAILIDRYFKYKCHNKETLDDDMEPKNLPLASAVGEVLGVVQDVISRTLKHSSQTAGGVMGNPDMMKRAELRLVQSVDLIPGTKIPFETFNLGDVINEIVKSPF